jgi:hypothetical protein
MLLQRAARSIKMFFKKGNSKVNIPLVTEQRTASPGPQRIGRIGLTGTTKSDHSLPYGSASLFPDKNRFIAERDDRGDNLSVRF